MLSISPILRDYHSLPCGRKDNHALLFEDNKAVGRSITPYCIDSAAEEEHVSW